MKTYVNSRGDEEERIMAIANYLNSEEHLTESMAKEPHKVAELTKQLDRVRESRQKLVREWSKGRANSNHWCNAKHQINTCYHLHELITNAARDNPDSVPELVESYKRCIKERDNAIDLFMSGDGTASGDGCQRCSADLNLTSTCETYVSSPVAFGVVEDDGDEKLIWALLLIMFVGVALLGRNHQP